jgi:hypothetical protein
MASRNFRQVKNMTKKNTLVQFSFGLPLMLSMAAALLAQPTNGTIRGTVLDPSGALVPGAQITITNETGFSRTLKSGATGSFEVPHLAPGSYSVSINASGFTPALEGGIQVVGDGVTEEKIKLGISVDSEIDVTADDTGR